MTPELRRLKYAALHLATYGYTVSEPDPENHTPTWLQGYSNALAGLCCAAQQYTQSTPQRAAPSDVVRVERGDWERAGGAVECTVCGCCYYDHAEVRGYAWLRRACDGRLLKT